MENNIVLTNANTVFDATQDKTLRVSVVTYGLGRYKNLKTYNANGIRIH